MNLRLWDYEPHELPDCSILRFLLGNLSSFAARYHVVDCFVEDTAQSRPYNLFYKFFLFLSNFYFLKFQILYQNFLNTWLFCKTKPPFWTICTASFCLSAPFCPLRLGFATALQKALAVQRGC